MPLLVALKLLSSVSLAALLAQCALEVVAQGAQGLLSKAALSACSYARPRVSSSAALTLRGGRREVASTPQRCLDGGCLCCGQGAWVGGRGRGGASGNKCDCRRGGGGSADTTRGCERRRERASQNGSGGCGQSGGTGSGGDSPGWCGAGRQRKRRAESSKRKRRVGLDATRERRVKGRGRGEGPHGRVASQERRGARQVHEICEHTGRKAVRWTVCDARWPAS